MKVRPMIPAWHCDDRPGAGVQWRDGEHPWVMVGLVPLTGVKDYRPSVDIALPRGIVLHAVEVWCAACTETYSDQLAAVPCPGWVETS